MNRSDLYEGEERNRIGIGRYNSSWTLKHSVDNLYLVSRLFLAVF